jgi:hypothetical protein
MAKKEDEAYRRPDHMQALLLILGRTNTPSGKLRSPVQKGRRQKKKVLIFILFSMPATVPMKPNPRLPSLSER